MGSHPGQDPFIYALKSNEAWANYKGHQNPNYFSKLAEGQAPKILWFGCSDSRVPETTVLGLQPGDVFTHRNIANIVAGNDNSARSVLEYAVQVVKVDHIVLCGHTSCGGCAGALSNQSIGGSLDAWLSPLRSVMKEHQAELDAIPDMQSRQTRLAELNVEAGVKVLESIFLVEEAVEKRGLQVHGVLYDLACGKLKDLQCSKTGKSKIGGASTASEGEIVKGNHGVLVFGNSGASMAVR